MAIHSHEPNFGAPTPASNVLANQESASTMCVLSQDNESKRVFERLYEKGVTQVKKRLEEQEEKRLKENEVCALSSLGWKSSFLEGSIDSELV